MIRALLLAAVILAGSVLAGGRAGYRFEAGSEFSIRIWAEEVLAAFAGFEQVAGAELVWDHDGLKSAAYTGIGYNAAGWWVQAAIFYGPGGYQGVALIGGFNW